MQGLTERTILKEGMVKITNLRAIFGTKTYEISNITSVHLYVTEPNLFLPVFFAVVLGFCSALVAIADIEEYSQCLQVGFYAGIAGILFFLISRKTKYSVQLKNPVSELIVLETYDGNYAERIVKAVNEAIASLDT
jgi:hypothetical protein